MFSRTTANAAKPQAPTGSSFEQCPKSDQTLPSRAAGCNDVTFVNRISPLLSRGPIEPEGAGSRVPRGFFSVRYRLPPLFTRLFSM